MTRKACKPDLLSWSLSSNKFSFSLYLPFRAPPSPPDLALHIFSCVAPSSPFLSIANVIHLSYHFSHLLLCDWDRSGKSSNFTMSRFVSYLIFDSIRLRKFSFVPLANFDQIFLEGGSVLILFELADLILMLLVLTGPGKWALTQAATKEERKRG
jgi:hypothetical protein